MWDNAAFALMPLLNRQINDDPEQTRLSA